MNALTKSYASKSIARQALKSIFGAGPYSQGGFHAAYGFLDGQIHSDNSITLSSSWFHVSSLESIFLVGLDKYTRENC